MRSKANEEIRFSKKHIFLFFIFILTSCLSLYGVYHIASDKNQVIDFSMFPSAMFPILIIVVILYYFMDVIRFKFIMNAIEVKVPIKLLMKLTFINMFISNITPSAMGGGFIQVYFLNKEGVDLGKATAGSILRAMLAMSLFMLSAPLIMIFDQNIQQQLSGYNLLFFAILMLSLESIILYLFFTLSKNPNALARKGKALVKFFYRIFRKEVEGHKLEMIDEEIKKFSSTLKMFRNGKKSSVVLAILTSVLFLLFLFLIPAVLIYFLNPNTIIIEVMLSMVVITSIMYFSPTPGASGIAEISFVMIFSKYVQKSEIVVLVFLWRLTTIYLGVLIGMLLFYREFFKKKNQKRC